jgi:phosphoribosylamine--glycine ligase
MATRTTRKGDVVQGLDRLGIARKLFHAGTANRDGKVVTAGGRVFCAVGLGATVRGGSATPMPS